MNYNDSECSASGRRSFRWGAMSGCSCAMYVIIHIRYMHTREPIKTERQMSLSAPFLEKPNQKAMERPIVITRAIQIGLELALSDFPASILIIGLGDDFG